MKFPIIFLIPLFFFFYACKSDSKNAKAPSEIETAYFDDYDSPRYKWSYINTNGELIFDPIYDNVRDFIDGKAVVNLNGKWGIIDNQNNEIIPFIYKELSPLNKSVSLAKTFENDYLIVNEENDTIALLQHKEVYAFSEGLARFKGDKGWGFINTKGEIIIEPEYQSVMDFKNGKAIVNRHNKKGIIDSKGTRILPLEYDQLSIHDNYYRVATNNKWGLIEIDGKEILPLNHDQMSPPKDNLTLITTDSKKQIFNLKTKKTKKVQREIINYAGEGLWVYKERERFGLCNSDEEEITKRLYDIIYPFQEGKAAYNLGQDSWGYLNTDGTELTPPIFPLNWSFQNGYGRVIMRTGIGFIDIEGKTVIPGQFREVKNFQEGFARVQVFRR